MSLNKLQRRVSSEQNNYTKRPLLSSVTTRGAMTESGTGSQTPRTPSQIAELTDSVISLTLQYWNLMAYTIEKLQFSTLIKSYKALFPEKAMATYSSTLAWKIPWMEEPGRLQSIGSQRVGHD